MTTKANSPVTAGSIVVPLGHVVGNEKWRGSELAQRLQGKHKLEEEKQVRQNIPLYCPVRLRTAGICFSLCLTGPIFVVQTTLAGWKIPVVCHISV